MMTMPLMMNMMPMTVEKGERGGAHLGNLCSVPLFEPPLRLPYCPLYLMQILWAFFNTNIVDIFRIKILCILVLTVINLLDMRFNLHERRVLVPWIVVSEIRVGSRSRR